MISPSPRCRAQKTVVRIIAGLFVSFAFFGAKEVAACPDIVEHPASVDAEIGQKVTFSVTAVQRTKLPVSVQWRRNGANIPGAFKIFREVPGTITDSYTITSAQPSDGGLYSAVVFDEECTEHTKIARLSFPQLPELPFNDKFEERGFITNSFGTGIGSNISAESPPVTPRNDNIPGGKMVWLEWIAPGRGIATFDTCGSDFDTTLGIYTGTQLPYLTATAGDDDTGNYYNSRVRFNVLEEGQKFQIGVDGYYGKSGHIVLNWSFTNKLTTPLLPEITNHPKSRTVPPLDEVELSVAVRTNTQSPRVLYQWFFNNELMDGKTQPVLGIDRVTIASVGEYCVRVVFADQGGNFAVTSKTAQIQINVEGNTNAAAGPKLHQVADPNYYPGGPMPKMVPVRGFTGTQLYNSYGSEREPGEPDHCGQAGGSSSWYSYQLDDTGTLTVDANTSYDAALAVYTWPGVTNYSDLVSVTCSSTNPGPGHETVVFPVTGGTIYYLVVDGANGGYGTVALTHSFTAPPQIITQPQSQTVPQGSNAVLTVSASGVPEPAYQWRRDGTNFSGRTNASLTLINFQAVNQRGYDVVVTNSAGAATSSVANLYLDTPLRFGDYTLTPTGGFSMLLLGMANSNYVLQAKTDLMMTNWIPVLTTSSPYGILRFTDTNLHLFTNRFYRAITY
jgi:hypothetical protein